MKAKRAYVTRREEQRAYCDRCGFAYVKADLVKQKGLLVCEMCFDEPSYDEAGEDD